MLKPLSARKILNDALLLTISLSLSGALPAVHSLLATSPTAAHAAEIPGEDSLLSALNARGARIGDSLQLLVRRARYPGTPGTPAGLPSPADVVLAERELLEFRGQVESILTSRNAGIGADTQLTAINLYLNQVTLLATLRIALNLPHGPGWSGGLALRMPRAVSHALPGLGRISTSGRMGDRFMPLVIDHGADGKADPVQLRISNSLVQGLELGHLAGKPSSKTHLTMLQYMATRQLLQNLFDLRYLKQDRSVAPPRIPAELGNKLKSLGLAALIDEEQRRAQAEPGARQALIDSFHGIAGRLPGFVNAGYARALGSVFCESAARRCGRVSAALEEALREAEEGDLAAAVKQELQGAALPFSALPGPEMIPALRAVAADAMASVQLGKIVEMLGSGLVDDLSTRQREHVVAALDARKAEYHASIDESVLRDWHEKARLVTDEEVYQRRRQRFVDDLLARAPLLSRELQLGRSADRVDFGTLDRALGGVWRQKAPGAEAEEWRAEISRSASWASARDAYGALVARVIAPSVVVGGIVHMDEASRAVRDRDYEPKLELSREVTAEQRKRAIERIASTRRKAARDLLAYGDVMGFHRGFPATEPTIAQLLPHPGRRELYVKQLELDALDRNPILLTDVAFDNGQWLSSINSGVRLADALVAINPRGESSPEIMERAERLVDEALIRLESQIHDNIRTVAEAGSADEIEKVVGTSMMISMAMNGFPEFHLQQQDLLARLTSPSLTDRLFHRYVGNYIVWGGLAVMAVQAGNWAVKQTVRKAFPVSYVLTSGFNALVMGYMRSMMAFIVADTAYQGAELWQKRSEHKQTEAFFASAAQGSGLISAGEREATDTGYQYSKWAFLGRMLMDTMFMYAPMGGELVSHRNLRVTLKEFAETSQDLARMGLGSDAFDLVQPALEAARALRSASDAGRKAIARVAAAGDAAEAKALNELVARLAALDPAQFEEVEAAGRRLLSKIQAGRTYSLDTTYREMLIEDSFAALGLSAKNARSWDGIHEGFQLSTHAGTSASQRMKAKRALQFLARAKKADPSIVDRAARGVTAAERRLAKALGKTPMLNEVWQAYTEAELMEQLREMLVKAAAQSGGAR